MSTGESSMGTGERSPAQDWARDAVIYQIYPRSFADGNGDGSGDLRGVIAHLDHLERLGVDALWLSPFYPSPQNDAGYDVSDYCDVDPLYGSLADFDELLGRAHALGLKVIVDLVPNHTSSRHRWFREALAAGAGESAARSRYHFRPGRGADGELPPNNWRSVFGGPAWTRTDEDGQWYLHLFDPSQPDLNWTDPAVHAEFEEVLRFWLDRGVDGFRVDVAHGLVKAAGLPDQTLAEAGPEAASSAQSASSGQSAATAQSASPAQSDDSPFFDQEGVHEIYRSWRQVLDDYPGQRILVAEAWVEPLERLFRYVRPGEMDQAFNFTFLMAGYRAPGLHTTIDETYAAAEKVGSAPTWVLSNHDTVRHASRFGLESAPAHQRGIGPDDPQPDRELGRQRAAALALIEFGLPGSAYVFQGDELGLPEHTELQPEQRQDPVFVRSQGTELGRDGARIPLPWSAEEPHLGFGTSPATPTWLPQPEGFGEFAVDRQEAESNSMLHLYRRLLQIRRRRGLGRGSFAWHDLNDPDHGLLAFAVTAGEAKTLVIANLGDGARTIAELPDGRILTSSRPGSLQDPVLAAAAAIWWALD